MNAIHIQTAGMHCDKCPPRIEHMLESLPGVMAARAYRLMELTSVLYDPEVIDAKSIESAITDAGFTSTGMLRGKVR